MNEQASELALVFHVDGRPCALPLQAVVETMRPLPIEPLAGAPAFVRGVALVRGRPTPVVEARRLLGAAAAGGAGGRWILLGAGGHAVALEVDDVPGVQQLPAEHRADMPPLLQGAAEGVVATLGRLDAQLLLVLQAARLVPEPVWAAIARQGAAA